MVMLFKTPINRLLNIIGKAFNIVFCLVVVILCVPDVIAAQRVNINRSFPVIRAENRLWFGTPDGLYQYDPGDNSFKRFNISTQQETSNVKQLYYNDEILWCGSGEFLGALHIRLNEWLLYDTSAGLPSNSVNGLVLTDDYAWAATDRGIARFDLLIEEWEVYDQSDCPIDGPVNDIVALEDNLWFVTGNSLVEYDPYFEKWRRFGIKTDSAFELNRGFLFGDELWLTGDNGILRFNPEMQTWRTYLQSHFTSEKLIELFIEDDLLWAVTQDGLFGFSLETGVWKAFEGNSYLNSANLVNAYIDRSEIWILLDDEVRVWSRDDNSWEIIDYASGLSSADYQALYVDGGSVYLFNPEATDYRLSANEVWRQYRLVHGAGFVDKFGRQVFKDLLDNESGGHIDLGNYDWSWAGTRMTFIRDYQKTTTDSGVDDQIVISSGERFDIKSRINLGEYRSLSGYYNNIDYGETEYGIRYRGHTTDYFREFNWGDYTLEAGNNPFAQQVRLFGSNIWLRAGSKTRRFKRSRFNLKAYSGEQQTRKTYENFRGATNEIDLIVADTTYLKRQFYAIPDPANLSEFEQISIYIDDLNHATNSANTIINQTIAGVTGDYDLQVAGEDYYIYETHNTIRFMKTIGPDHRVVARYTSGSFRSEVVLWFDNNTNTARRNVYYLGGTGIIPYSFNIEITDSTGNPHPISEFDIDDNGDNLVDADRIDYQNGLLIFPDSQPFPPEVYDHDQPQSYYQLRIQYQTDVSLIQLQNRNLVRGSENLKLDGTIAVAGSDYVIDYTNGTLVFVRDGVVSADTRIEIEYQYYLMNFTWQVHGAKLTWNPGDDLLLQGEWLQLPFEDGNQADINTKNLFTLNGEIRRRINGFDLKMVPALAYNFEDNNLTGVSWEGLLSSSTVRFQSLINYFSEGYINLYRPQFMFGDIKQQIQLSASADVREDTRILVEWDKSEGFSIESSLTPEDRTGKIGLLFQRNLWPVWRLSYQDIRTESTTGKSSKSYFQADLEYQLPTALTRRLPIYGLRLEASVREGRQSGLANLGADKTRFNLGHVRLNTSVSERLQGSFYYRREYQSDVTETDRHKPVYRSERFLMDFDFEQWRLLQTYIRLENKITRKYQADSNSRDINLAKSYQLNLRFAPGVIFQLFSPMHFEFNFNQSFSTWGSTYRDNDKWIWQIMKQDYDLEGNIQDIRNYYLKNELNLGSRFMVTSLGEWNKQNTKLSASSLDNDYWRWSEKLSLKLNFKTRLNLQYRQYYQDREYDRTDTYYEPSTWIEYRWTPEFQNTYYLLYRERHQDNGNLHDNIVNWEARYDIIWGKSRVFLIRRFELRQSLFISYIRSEGSTPQQVYQYNSNSAVDFYPIHSAILRFQFDLTRQIDRLSPGNNHWNLGLNFKLSFRF
ncbi:MAG: hypothetical protein GY839_03710 [candidate division Zixibacteria bacterium]|nr:hypothetical protein [candidate division Zixibacteria bacterium]